MFTFVGLGLFPCRSWCRSNHLSNVYIVNNDWLLIEIYLPNLGSTTTPCCVWISLWHFKMALFLFSNSTLSGLISIKRILNSFRVLWLLRISQKFDFIVLMHHLKFVSERACPGWGLLGCWLLLVRELLVKDQTGFGFRWRLSFYMAVWIMSRYDVVNEAENIWKWPALDKILSSVSVLDAFFSLAGNFGLFSLSHLFLTYESLHLKLLLFAILDAWICCSTLLHLIENHFDVLYFALHRAVCKKKKV